MYVESDLLVRSRSTYKPSLPLYSYHTSVWSKLQSWLLFGRYQVAAVVFIHAIFNRVQFYFFLVILGLGLSYSTKLSRRYSEFLSPTPLWFPYQRAATESTFASVSASVSVPPFLRSYSLWILMDAWLPWSKTPWNVFFAYCGTCTN